MRTLTLLLTILGLTAAPAMALPGPGGGPKPKFQSGAISVTNNCDAAVQIDIDSFTAILEPNESAQTSIGLGNDSRRDVIVTATLVSDPNVTATQSCTVQKDKLTPATVTCSTTASGVALRIVCGRRTNLASVLTSRDGDVALAAAGGLGLLILFGTFLGRPPRRRDSLSLTMSLEGEHECARQL